MAAEYAHDLCDDCVPMKVRIADALQPGPHMDEWHLHACRRCEDIREVVGDVVGLRFGAIIT